MREIKFRAWDGKKMLTPTYQLDRNGHWATNALYETYFIKPGYATSLDTHRLTVSQYTGFQDESGRDIYEGDILETNGIDGRLLWQVGYFDDGGGGSLGSFEAEPVNHRLSSVHNRVIETGAVIGNVYENPELIK
jgi:hypothetical protein